MDLTRPHYAATIKMVGLGSSAAEAVNRFVDRDLEGVDFVLVQTDDARFLSEHAGVETGDGDGTAQDPETKGNIPVKPQVIKGDKEEIRGALKDADMIVLVAGEGSEPEIGVAPLIGEVAKDMGALIAGVIARPVDPEGPHNSTRTEEGVHALREAVDMLIMVPDNTLLPGFFAALRGR